MRRSKYDIAVNIACVLLLSGIVIYLAVNWSKIPEQIPGHYNVYGVVDRWTNKGELLIPPIVGWIMFIGLTVIGRYPQIWNTGVTITAENRERVYRVIKNMLGTMKLIMCAVFTILTLNSATAKGLPIWFLPVFLVLTFGTIIFSIVRLLQVK